MDDRAGRNAAFIAGWRSGTIGLLEQAAARGCLWRRPGITGVRHVRALKRACYVLPAACHGQARREQYRSSRCVCLAQAGQRSSGISMSPAPRPVPAGQSCQLRPAAHEWPRCVRAVAINTASACISCARQMASQFASVHVQLEVHRLGCLYGNPRRQRGCPRGARRRGVFGCCSSRKTSAESPPGGTGWAGCFPPRTKSGSATAKCQRRRRSRAGENFFQRGVVSGKMVRIIQRTARSFRKAPSASNPVPASRHLPLREASGAITFNRRVFHDVTAYRVRGFSPLAGDLIGHFHCDLHNAVNLTQ